MSMSKIDPVEKLQTIRLILEGKETQRHAADRLGIRLPSIQQWISIYNSEGEEAFTAAGFKRYSKELKEQAVLDYLCKVDQELAECCNIILFAHLESHLFFLLFCVPCPRCARRTNM